jgi:hypothetical protein
MANSGQMVTERAEMWLTPHISNNVPLVNREKPARRFGGPLKKQGFLGIW